MKNKYICLVFLIAAASIRPAAALPDGLRSVLDKAGVEMTEADLYRVAEFYNFWEQKGDQIWPGMEISTVPVQLIFPGKLGLLIGHPNPPEGCEPGEGLVPVLDRPFCHRPDRTFMYGAGTIPQNRVPVVSFNTIDVFDGYIKEYYAKNKIELPAGYTKPYLQYIGEIAHELTHAYQMTQQRYLPEKERRVSPPRLTKVDYPYQDEENCLLLGLEGRVLTDIIDATEGGDSGELWKDFLAVREARRARLHKDNVKLEKYMELSEGTAQYVGWTVEKGAHPEVKPLPQTLADPKFSGYASSDTLRGLIKERLLTLHQPLQSRWMLYVYTTGLALSYNMDTVSPGWKKGLFGRISGIGTGLDDLVTAGAGKTGNKKKRLAAVYSRYGADKIRAEVKEALDKDLAESKVKIDKFLAAPGKRYELVFRSSDPEDILTFAPVLFTEYRQLRILEAGITKVMYDRGRKSQNTVSFAKALPVLHYRDEGRLEFALEEASEPVIKAAKKKVRKDSVVYSGGVEYDNGVFSWKGERLEISDSGGRVKLVF